MSGNKLVIDSHAHVYPRGDQFCEWDYQTVEEWHDWKKMGIYASGLHKHKQGRPSPVMRTDGREDADGAGWRCLWDEGKWARWGGRRMWEGINRDIKLSVRDGKVFWRSGGVEYCVAGAGAYPGSVEHAIGCMDAAGVDMAVFQTSKYLSRYACRQANRYPGRLIPLCGVNEEMAHEDEELEKLRMFVRDLGFKGLYYASPAAPWPSWDGWDDSRYDPFWKELEQSGVIVYFNAQFNDDNRNYDITIPKLVTVLEKFPSLKMVFLHGFPERYFTGDVEPALFETAVDIVRNHDIILELLPLIHGPARRPDFPGLFKDMLKRLGPEKFVWGSELTGVQPTVEEYKKRRGHIEKECGYLSKDELALIMGGNLQRMFGL